MSAAPTGQRVAILQRVLPHYRVAFFEALSHALEAEGVELQVLFGRERPGTVPVSVQVHASWARPIKNHYAVIASHELVWQSCLSNLRTFDLVIAEQANRLLLNYWLIARRHFCRQRFALWGHGGNWQARDSSRMRETLKNIWSRQVDWWFAYTEQSARLVVDAGFPPSQVTVVNNAIDIEELQLTASVCSDADIQRLKTALRITGTNVAAFCGGMYPNKELGFLLDACEEIRQRLPDFEMLFIGDGPEQGLVERACRNNSWMRYIGPVYGPERARYLKLCKVLLMPGTVGLVVLDSFAVSCPLITCETGRHSPEIAYLASGHNGVIAGPSREAYVEAVCRVMSDEGLLHALREGCVESASKYPVEGMVQRFKNGIVKCLSADSMKAM